MNSTQSTDSYPTAIILAGGKGVRLQAVYPDRPKPMVPVSGRPFIEYLIRYLAMQEISEIIVSTGYKAEMIESYLLNANLPAKIRCIREPIALGTGGSLSYVLAITTTNPWILVANADSLTPFCLQDMIIKARSGVDAVILGIDVPDSKRFGNLTLDTDGLLVGFQEKSSSSSSGLINGGIYLFKRDLFSVKSPQVPESLELDYFPKWLQQGKRIAVLRNHAPFIDIGTPESLAEAAHFLESNEFLSLVR